MNRIHGINLPYFFEDYGHDLAPNVVLAMGPRKVDPMRIYAALLAARERGFRAVRVWLCENAEGILMDAGVISGAHPVLVESVAIIQECASLSGLRLYWTLLDGHSCRRTGDQVSKAILTMHDETGRFAERVAAPLVRRLDSGLTLAVEVVNEPEALSTDGSSSGSSTADWQALGVAIRTIADAVRAEHGRTLVTAGSHQRRADSALGKCAGFDRDRRSPGCRDAVALASGSHGADARRYGAGRFDAIAVGKLQRDRDADRRCPRRLFCAILLASHRRSYRVTDLVLSLSRSDRMGSPSWRGPRNLRRDPFQ